MEETMTSSVGNENTMDMNFTGVPDIVPEIPSTPASSPAQDPAMSVVTTQAPPANNSIVLHITGMDKTMINEKSVMNVPLGTVISKLPIEKMKFSKSKRELMAVLTRDIIAMKIHWDKELGGGYQCFGGKCCDEDLPDVRYVLPVIIYDTDKSGTKVLSYNWWLKGLVLSPNKSYDKIVTIASLSGDITSVDILCTCMEEQYQDIDFQSAGPSRWKTNKTMVDAIVKEFQAKSKYLPLILGRKMTEELYNKKKNTSSSVQQFFQPQNDSTTAAFANAFNDVNNK